MGRLPSTISFQSPDRTAACTGPTGVVAPGRRPVWRQKIVRSISGSCPANTPNRLIPSRRASAGTGVFVAARIDAVRSIVMPTWRETRPAGIRPGQRTIAGTRMPPSHRVPFRWKNGALRDSALAAVVVGEDNDGVPRELQPIQRLENPTDAVIGPLKDCRIIGAGGRLVDNRRRPRRWGALSKEHRGAGTESGRRYRRPR